MDGVWRAGVKGTRIGCSGCVLFVFESFLAATPHADVREILGMISNQANGTPHTCSYGSWHPAPIPCASLTAATAKLSTKR